MDDSSSGFQVLSFVKSDRKIRDYKKQRQHRKTRSGCLPCKEKKVKCDENKPICLRCRRNRRTCAYDIRSTEDSIMESLTVARLSTASSINATLSPSPKNGTPGVPLLHHFLGHYSTIIPMPGRDQLITLSQTNPLIQNTLIAITACHLRHLFPTMLSHRIAEHFYTTKSIRSFQTALRTPGEGLGQEGVNALLLSALLLNMIAFTLPHQDHGREVYDDDSKSSWVFRQGEEDLGWLALQTGLRPLLLSLSAYTQNTVTFLDPIMFGHGRAGWSEVRTSQSLSLVPDTWLKAFNIPANTVSYTTPFTCDSPNIFAPAVIILAYLRRLKPEKDVILLNWVFLGKIHGELKELLWKRDRMVLWLVGYWLGLVGRWGDVWWCEGRVGRDYWAVLRYLEGLRSEEIEDEDRDTWREMMRELEELAPKHDSTENALL